MLIVLPIALVAGLLHASTPLEAEEFISVDEVRRGMEGYGLTVFEGTRIDTFRFEALGVARGSRPQQDIV